MLSSSLTFSNSPAEVKLSARAAEKVRRGAIFVLRADILAAPQGGDIVYLSDERGRPLGSALWAPTGPIAARIYARQRCALGPELLKERILSADARRQALFRGSGRDAYRLVHGEADLLPGLIVDRYGDAAVIQTATTAMDARKELLAELLHAVLGVSQVICRDDGSARDLEALPRVRGILYKSPALDQAASTRVRFHDAGSLMEADLLTDRKTGSFLDQQENHAAAADYATRLFPQSDRPLRALDCFTYHGGFALSLARAGLQVTACDEDGEAIERARKNAALSSVSVDFRHANAFDLLRSLEASGERFDVVVLDPPALAKRGRGRTPDSAWQRAYKELNLRGLRLLSPGGLLCTCSCSGRVTLEEFGALIESAARDVGRTIQILERRGAGRDHPVLLGWPESEYLKCWFLRALS